MSRVRLEIQGQQARLILDRADKRNAMTKGMWQDLIDHCDTLSKGASQVRVVVLESAGDKAFCAGADIAELNQQLGDVAAMKASQDLVQQAQILLEQLPQATIAKVQGDCFGGGMGLAAACDFRLCVGHSRFAVTPAKLGLLYSLEDTQRLLNLVGLARAKQLLLLGRPINASTAEAWGLVTQVVEAEQLDDTVAQMIEHLVSVSGQSIAGMKRTLAALAIGTDFESEVRQLFSDAFESKDFKEGAAAFLQKRPPNF
ncbi:enoyl-CoA hydratase/isomerase family protein [Paraferrimonas sedimenticola]|uniref:Enoyl-CoA hydratase n=1 Tax=Paraferrimonas sedimenticola TaxID=375674 RepID=A0AA37RVN8_9GAMM|nr:enoyl-CoA hydratase/isomerase family protein [Paraferrimonas sedimenticola]GLP96270.1 enoyl-CoA hydratase [Paraferrimonas sedimenticola]